MTETPPTPSGGPPPTPSGGLAPNVAAALAYLWIVAIIWLVMEPYNKDPFIRFHSFQALILGVASIVVSIVLGFIPILGCFLPLIWGLLVLVVWVICIVKAYQNEKFKLPVIGDFAEQQAGS